MNRNSAPTIRSVPLTVPSKPATGAGRSMGTILVDAGRLSPPDAERILQALSAKVDKHEPGPFSEERTGHRAAQVAGGAGDHHGS
jgi:hypothetical protein